MTRLEEKVSIPKYTLGEELLNAISHGVGVLFAITACVLTVVFSALHNNPYAVVASSIYGSSLIILYTMSTMYHSLKPNKAKRIFRILDHDSIFILIAGTYTPYMLVTLKGTLGWTLFGIIWGCAVLGITLKSIDLRKYKKISTIFYLLMGWAIIFAIKPLINALDIRGIYLLVGGGIVYTIGAIFFSLGKNKKYMHSVFHIFVLVASILHFFSILLYVI